MRWKCTHIEKINKIREIIAFVVCVVLNVCRERNRPKFAENLNKTSRNLCVRFKSLSHSISHSKVYHIQFFFKLYFITCYFWKLHFYRSKNFLCRIPFIGNAYAGCCNHCKIEIGHFQNCRTKYMFLPSLFEFIWTISYFKQKNI